MGLLLCEGGPVRDFPSGRCAGCQQWHHINKYPTYGPEAPVMNDLRQCTSEVYEVADATEANELYQRNGWTDGLPIVAPTESAVRHSRAAAHQAPADVIGVEPVRRRTLTAEKVAIAAVMAGCLPEYLVVIVAIVRAMCQPEYALHGSTASTGGSAPFIVVNGPIRLALGMNTTHNVLANASRANATIGRTVRLVLLNVLGGIPGQLDRSTLGHPGKFTFCVAEDEEDSPWLPLSQHRGMPPGASAVTVMAAQAPRQIMNEWTTDPRETLETFAAEMRANLRHYSLHAGNYAIVIPKQLREHIQAAGWSKADIAAFIHERARIPRREWADVGKGAVVRDRGDSIYPALESPGHLLVIAAGGPAGGFGAVIPPWLGPKSQAVTMAIGACIDCGP